MSTLVQRSVGVIFDSCEEPLILILKSKLKWLQFKNQTWFYVTQTKHPMVNLWLAPGSSFFSPKLLVPVLNGISGPVWF
jgi:hypothetical protein